MSNLRRLSLALLATTALTGFPEARADPLPSGPSVAAGSVSIQRTGTNALTIHQSSANAVVNWRDFSIAADARVVVDQPSAQSILLNRVNGSATSTIAGQLSANGHVYLVNPNGIVITKTGIIDTGAFVASTLDITDRDLAAGRLSFTGKGQSAAITNAGTIEIRQGGYAALLAGAVDNSGTISVPAGRVGLASGEAITLDPTGDGFLQVAIPTIGSSRKALVEHSGRIRADGGRVEIKAAAARSLAREAINLSGSVEARTISSGPGVIVIGGGEGAVGVSGRLNAAVSNSGRLASNSGKGGAITVTGRVIELKGAELNASGATRGGSIRVGGDWQGRGTLQTAEAVAVDQNSRIVADAARTGFGGDVVIWSNSSTRFAGTISARGFSGGGEAEVSSKGILDFTGFADLRGSNGPAGRLLLDPEDIVIAAANPGGSASFVSTATLQSQLAAASVTIQTSASGTGNGDITVSDPVSWSANNNLKLSAHRTINVNAAIATSGTGGISLRADSNGSGTGTVAFGGAGSLNLNGGGASIYYNPTLAGGGAQDSASVNAVSYLNPTNYSAKVTGGTLTASMLVNTVYDLQNILNASDGQFALGKSIDASLTSTWNAGAGFAPLLLVDNAILDGLNHTISGLTINTPLSAFVGLVAVSSSISSPIKIKNLGLVGGSITGNNFTGALIGHNNGAVVSNVYSTAAVTGTSNVGGLIGYNFSTLTNTFASGSVSGTSAVGGLVGYNAGTIANAYAKGMVTGPNYTGGLAGRNTGSITNAYAEGSVSGTSRIGGLIGESTGTVSNTYSRGAVTGTTNVGGLIGIRPSGTVSNSYWNTTTSGRATSPGGGTGRTTTQMQDITTYSTIFSGWDFVNTWAPPNTAAQGGTAFYPQLYATSPVIALKGTSTVTFGPSAQSSLAVLGGVLTGSVPAYVFGPSGDAVSPPTLATHTITDTFSLGTSTGGYRKVGTYTVGAQASTVTSTLGQSYRTIVVPGTLTISKRALTVSATGQNKTYDRATTALVTLSNDRPTGDVLTMGYTTAIFASAAAGSGKTISVSRITAGGADFGNYTLANTTASAIATITPKAITVTATGQNKIYDGGLAATVTLSGSGVISGDAVSFSATSATFNDQHAGQIKPIAVLGLQMSGGDAANYSLTGTSTTTTATIDRRNADVIAAHARKQFGDVDPQLTTRFAGVGLVNGDTLTGAVQREPGEGFGTYEILQGTLALSPDYVMTFHPGIFSIVGLPQGEIASQTQITHAKAMARPVRVDDQVILMLDPAQPNGWLPGTVAPSAEHGRPAEGTVAACDEDPASQCGSTQ